MCEIVGSEAPEVHGNRSVVGDGYPFFVLIEILHLAVDALDFGAFHNAGQQFLLVHGANAAAYGSAVGKRVAYAEAYHGIFSGAAFGELAEELAHHLEGVAVVEVIAVDDSEGFLDGVLAHHHRVVGSPGLGAAFGASEAFGQCVERLEYEFTGDVVFIFGEHDAAEVLFEILADNKHEFAESGVDGIVDGVVHDGLSVRAQSVQLLESAVAATHSSSEKEECRFH